MMGMGDPNNPMGISRLHPVGILETVDQNDFGLRRMAMLKTGQSQMVVNDSLVACVMTGIPAVDVMNAVTGWDMTMTEQLVVGERILTIARLFNIKQGFTDADDVIPDRYYQGKVDGALMDKPLNREQVDKARTNFYHVMGWDKKGVPLPETVELLYIE